MEAETKADWGKKTEDAMLMFTLISQGLSNTPTPSQQAQSFGEAFAVADTKLHRYRKSGGENEKGANKFNSLIM